MVHADRLSALPDGVLCRILGFLPAHEAVRTTVLAPRYRHLWKLVRRLHITGPRKTLLTMSCPKGNMCLPEFVGRLFLLRGYASLDEIKFDYDAKVLHHLTDIWVRQALLCQAQVLTVHNRAAGRYSEITLVYPPLVSSHLRKLELKGVTFKMKSLDFTRCPALEVFMISDSSICTESILSPSIKFLRMENTDFGPYSDDPIRPRISVPSLVWLQLNFLYKTPLLESMLSLETASIKASNVPDTLDTELCDEGSDEDFCGICDFCCGKYDDCKGRCLLLGGLSNAVNLELTAFSRRYYIFRRDLRWCPTFSKLKTLLVNDWCVAVDMSALVCILEHSPVLENLTLLLRKGPEFPVQAEGNNTSEKLAALSGRLKKIKIQCEAVDDRVCKLVQFLSLLDTVVTIERTKE